MAMSPYYVQYLLTQGDLFSRILSFNADFSARQSSLRAAKGNDDIKDSLYHVHPELARFHEKNNISYYFENSVDRLCLIRQEELETLLVYLGACISSSQLASLTRQEDKDTVYESIGRDTYEFALDYGYLIKNLDFMINIDGIKQDCIYLGLCAVKCLRPLFSRQDLAEYFIDFLITYARSHDLDPNIITSETHVLSVVYNTAALHQVPSAEVMNNPVQYTPVDNHPRLAKGLSDLIEQAQIDELAAVAAATAPAVEAARAASAQAADNSASASGSAAAQSEAAQPAAQADAGNEAATGTGQEAPSAPEGAAATADAAASAPAQAAQSTDSATSDQSAQPAQQASGQTDAKDAPAQDAQPENNAAQSSAPANAPEAAAAPAAQGAEGESSNKDDQAPAAPADAAPADSAPADGAAAQPEDKTAADGAAAADGQNAADNSAAPAHGENAAPAEAASTQSQTAAPAADSAASAAATAASGSAAAQAPADSYIETVPDKYDDVPEGVGSPLPPTYESAALYGGLNSKDKRMFRAASHKQRTALLELEQADTQEKEIQTLEQEKLITLEFNEHQVYKLTHLILCSQISDNWYEYLQE